MSSDPSPHLPSPVAPPGAAEADPQPMPLPAAPPAEPLEVMHRTRAVDFLGRRTPIVYQNDNGPCPLLAICNVLLLKNVISLNPDAGEVSQQKLLSLVAERLIDSNTTVQDKDEEYVRNREQNIADAIDLLPLLATGIDVNVMFRKIDDFEFTRERAIFDLLDIPLYHGWIVDPQDTETASAIGSKSYNALASGLAEFKSGKPTEENKHVEEETVDFAAAALKIPSPSVSRARSFDEHTISNSAEPHKRRGDLEEEEELMRVLNLSKGESVDTVDGEVSFDASHSHSSSNMEETPQSESFQSEAPELVGATKKEEHGNHAVSDDGSVIPVTNGAVNGSGVVPEESQEILTSKEPEDSGINNMLPEDLDIPVQSSVSSPPCPYDESFPTCDHQPAVPTLVEGDKETCREQFEGQIHGHSSDTKVACDSSVATYEAAPGHATTELDVKSDSFDNAEPLPSSIQECEPIYQGEEHILGTTNMVYENQEPVYEGEAVLPEQADKIGDSSHSVEDKTTEHQWELIDNFLRTTANQLTVYGLFCLQEGLNQNELCVFFRNNHFNTMFKYKGSLYLLATDQGFISQTDLVWQKLDEVNGDGVFLTSNFTPFKAETPRNDSWNEQQAMTSTADCLAQFDNSTSGNSDLELAIALQQQEFERQQQRFQAPPPQQQQQQQQPQTQHQPTQSRPGLVVGSRVLNHLDRRPTLGDLANAPLVDVDVHTLSPVGKEETKKYIIPANIYQILKPHQRQGLEWLWGIHCHYPGGIVADDMGLGKTLQMAIFLSGLVHSNLIHNALIIVKLGLLKQWSDELEKAGLGKNVQVFYNHNADDIDITLKDDVILLTTYETYFRYHRSMMRSALKKWDYAILDEAHKIKNPQSQITLSVNKIQSNKKILITGTPLQKDLMDIYSLMTFIDPNILGDEDSFHEIYMRPVKEGRYENATEIEKRHYLKALEKLRRITSPYILRRKKDVLIESGDLLCKKHDVVVWLRMTDLQVSLYKGLYSSNIKSNRIQHNHDKTSFLQSQISHDICISPSRLLEIRDAKGSETPTKRMATKLLGSLKIDDELYRSNNSSCKIIFIQNLIKELFEEENTQNLKELKKRKVLKILVFSQHIYMLDALQDSLNAMAGGIIRIDGSVNKKKRDDLLQKFNSKDGPRIFLLSAKAGGEGLNLTAATRVIIVDPSWNNSEDNQISDRVYRIGQDEDVFIYRLFTCGTIEEHSYKTQLLKGSLGHAVIEGKFCAASVKKQEGKVLRLPRGGFDSSETQKLLETTIGNAFEMDDEHLEFLRSHSLVAGLTDQNLVFSKEEKPFSGLSEDESSDKETNFARVPRKFRCKNVGETMGQSLKAGTGRQLPHKKGTKSKQEEAIVSIHTIEIPEDKVGAVLGKGGDTIRHLQMASSACISVDKHVDPVSRHVSVKIIGTAEEFKKANEMIRDVISKAQQRLETCFDVPEHKIGWIIGTKGQTVKGMEQESGASIKHKGGGRFRISGTKTQVETAQVLMSRIIDKPSRPTRQQYADGNTFSSDGTGSRGNKSNTYGVEQGGAHTSRTTQPSNLSTRSEYYGERGSKGFPDHR